LKLNDRPYSLEIGLQITCRRRKPPFTSLKSAWGKQQQPERTIE
jgi:hypothetical protein